MSVKFQRAREFLERPELMSKEVDHCLWRYNQYKEQLRLSTDMYWEIAGLFAENPLLAPTKHIQEAFETAVIAREKAIVQVDQVIKAVTTGNVYDLMTERYVCYQSLTAIGEKNYWSKRWVIRLHMQGLEAVEHYLEEHGEPEVDVSYCQIADHSKDREAMKILYDNHPDWV